MSLLLRVVLMVENSQGRQNIEIPLVKVRNGIAIRQVAEALTHALLPYVENEEGEEPQPKPAQYPHLSWAEALQRSLVPTTVPRRLNRGPTDAPGQ